MCFEFCVHTLPLANNAFSPRGDTPLPPHLHVYVTVTIYIVVVPEKLSQKGRVTGLYMYYNSMSEQERFQLDSDFHSNPTCVRIYILPTK